MSKCVRVALSNTETKMKTKQTSTRSHSCIQLETTNRVNLIDSIDDYTNISVYHEARSM